MLDCEFAMFKTKLQTEKTEFPKYTQTKVSTSWRGLENQYWKMPLLCFFDQKVPTVAR
jgi:hypothetical protein